MVAPFDPVLIALMNGIHPDIARLTVGLRLASRADGMGDGPGLSKLPTHPRVSAGTPQVVQMRYRDTGQSLIGREIKSLPGALTWTRKLSTTPLPGFVSVW